MARNKHEIKKVICETVYHGILILRHYTQYLSVYGYVVSSREYFQLCKDGDTENPWKHSENRLYTYYETLDKAKEGVDKYLDGSIILYTDAQCKKYVTNYNKKYGWGFNRQRLLATMRMHKKGDKVMKLLMEDRLEDANFHDYCGALSNSDYDKFMEILNNDFKTKH